VTLREENNLEDENAVVDLIDRIFPDIALCQKLIEHENMCISKLESCCSDRLQESPDSVLQIWDFILESLSQYGKIFLSTRMHLTLRLS